MSKWDTRCSHAIASLDLLRHQIIGLVANKIGMSFAYPRVILLSKQIRITCTEDDKLYVQLLLALLFGIRVTVYQYELLVMRRDTISKTIPMIEKRVFVFKSYDSLLNNHTFNNESS